MARAYLLMLCFLFLFAAKGLSQDNYWIITIATGDTLSGCSLISLDGDSLRIAWSGFPVSLPVESLRKLQYHRKSEFWRGALYGSATGGLLGTLAGSSGAGSASAVTSEGALGVVCGFAIGGLAAEYLSRDDRYDLVNCETLEKKNIIRALLPHYQIRSEVEKPE